MEHENLSMDRVKRLLQNALIVAKKGRDPKATDEEKAAAEKLLYGGNDPDFGDFLEEDRKSVV